MKKNQITGRKAHNKQSLHLMRKASNSRKAVKARKTKSRASMKSLKNSLTKPLKKGKN